MDVQITKKSGESFALSTYSAIVQDFIVSSIPMDAVYSKAEGSDVYIDNGATFEQRTIRVPFTIKAYDLADFPLLRDLVFEKLVSKESYYIQEMRRPKKQAYQFVDPGSPPMSDASTDNKLVGGKRYLVRLQNTIDFDQLETYGESELVFETTELPFAESIGTTQDIQRDGISATSGIWGYGMGLIAEDASLKYTHTGASFSIYNAGNVDVHPFESYLKIIIDQVTGSTTNFTLTNQTTGDVFKVNEAVNSLSEIVLDGANITINAAAALRKTNRQYISLAPEYNQFKITGATSARVRFDFRFLYK